MTKGICTKCGQTVTGGRPCDGGVKIEEGQIVIARGRRGKLVNAVHQTNGDWFFRVLLEGQETPEIVLPANVQVEVQHDCL